MSWLWRSDTSSPASFEKALSKLSAQISSASSSLETTRSRARRAKALWTLYTTIGYLVYTLILALVLGPQKWSWPHYAGLAGAPAIIYAVRQGLTLFFDWRVSRQQSYLDALQQQRETKISDLKRATRYDSTQELIQKYGSSPRQTPSKQPPQGVKRKINPPPQPQPRRTGIAPPATANIPGRNSPATGPPPNTQGSPSGYRQPLLSSATHSPPSPDQPGFAPNAFTMPPPPSNSNYIPEPHWYDRILDVLLGEDETQAKNRLALICSDCRLVNGQAPPGVKTPEEIGKWRCSACGSWNGTESEAAKLAKRIAEQQRAEDEWARTSVEVGKDGDQGDGRVGNHVVEGGPDASIGTEAETETKAGAGVEVEEDADENGGTVEPRRVTRSAAAKQITEDEDDEE